MVCQILLPVNLMIGGMSKNPTLDSLGNEIANKYMQSFQQNIQNNCKLIDLILNTQKQNELLCGNGYRVIGVACGEVPMKEVYTEKDIKDLTYMGMVGFIDPIRKEVVGSIRECKIAGIKVLMVTGDHPLTAFAIAKELKLCTNYDSVSTGDEVDEYFEKGEEAFDAFVKEKIVFSRVTPIQKLEIVESLKMQRFKF